MTTDKGKAQEKGTTGKQQYIEAWQSHMKGLYTLYFTPNPETGERVKRLLDELHNELIPLIAEEKASAGAFDGED